MKNKSSKEISDLVTLKLKERCNVRFWDINILFNPLNLKWDIIKAVNALDILMFSKVLKRYSHNCWENMYFNKKEDKNGLL